MSGLELNKIAAAILLSSLIAMLVGFVANIIYKPTLTVAERGYQVEVEEDTAGGDQPEQAKLDIPTLMAQANAEAGAKIIKKCVSCHGFEKGGAHKIGPNLWHIVGAEKGKQANFVYSKALANAGGSWTEEDLFHFLNKPSKYLPGTKMSFAGIRNPEDIANVIAYLKSKAD